jgi:hypothetical protein
MISRSVFNHVLEKNANFASWAVWAKAGLRPKSNMGDLSCFSPERIEEMLPLLHTDFVLVGLNISTIDITIPLSNFHGENGEVYKARYALDGTPLWGAYMTDIIKNFKEPDSTKILRALKADPSLERMHVNLFREELSAIGAEGAALVAFGAGVFDILNRHFRSQFRLMRIPHYASKCNKETYKANVIHCLKNQSGQAG